MKLKSFILFFTFFLAFNANAQDKPLAYESETLKIELITQKESAALTIEWVNEVEGDYSFKEIWAYPEGIYKNSFGQISCDWYCPPKTDHMKTKEGMIIADSLNAFYNLVDTTHLFHSMQSNAMVYEWSGTDYMNFEQQADGVIIGQSVCNVSSHSSLNMRISNDSLTAWIDFNSIRDLGEHQFPLAAGSVKIDRALFEQGIVKATFDFKFKNTLDPNQVLFWKGLVYSEIEKNL